MEQAEKCFLHVTNLLHGKPLNLFQPIRCETKVVWRSPLNLFQRIQREFIRREFFVCSQGLVAVAGSSGAGIFDAGQSALVESELIAICASRRQLQPASSPSPDFISTTAS